MRPMAFAATLTLCVPVAACSGGGGGGGSSPAADPGSDEVTLVPVFDGLAFARPVKLLQHPTDDDRWYVVEQAGRILTFRASDPSGTLQTALDLDGVVNLGDTTREQGLLGMAFDPGFAVSGEIYLAYTDEAAQTSILARYESFDAGLSFGATLEPVVLSIAHPGGNHNAGDLAFGPDGLLYYSMGDGGGAGDPDDNAQDITTLLGAILRIDVGALPAAGERYVAPAGNPYVGNELCDGGSGDDPCPEIFAYGLRNPWRMSFDSRTGVLWAGDVGQSSQEEIDRIALGANYGWDCFEGELVFEVDPGCSAAVLEPPEVVHGRAEAASIIGGVVYRGSAIPARDGHYIYADFITGLFWALDVDEPLAPSEPLDLPQLSVAAFGQDRAGEVYVVAFDDPSIWQLVADPP